MEVAVQGVAKFLGMAICEGTDKVNVTEKVHNLLLSGMFMGQELVLARGQLGFNQEYGCVLKLTVRSTNEEVSRTVLEAIN
jgi:coatomer protein complex subunit gamma